MGTFETLLIIGTNMALVFSAVINYCLITERPGHLKENLNMNKS